MLGDGQEDSATDARQYIARWPQDFGYESDGQVPENMPALSVHCEEDTYGRDWCLGAPEVPSQDAKKCFNISRSHLREAVKTVAMATRTGTLGEQKRIADNWIIKCFIMTPLELVVTKIQRFWRKRRERRAYFARILHQYQQQRELIRRHDHVHRSLMKQQEDTHQRLVNRVRMFDCSVSKPKMLEYGAARRIQCAVRCRQARTWTRLWETAAYTIQKHYRRWVGSRAAGWKLRILQLRCEREQYQLFRRQKFIGSAVAQQELDILESYAAIEKEMISCRRNIELQEHTAEQSFKRRALGVRQKVLASAGLEHWVPQTGSVSGKTHYLHTLTGEVQQQHPHLPHIEKKCQQVREEVDAQLRPERSRMLAYLESLKGKHEDVYEKVADLLVGLRELNFKAQFK